MIISSMPAILEMSVQYPRTVDPQEEGAMTVGRERGIIRHTVAPGGRGLLSDGRRVNGHFDMTLKSVTKTTEGSLDGNRLLCTP